VKKQKGAKAKKDAVNKQRFENREDSKMVNELEKSVRHRWVNLTLKRGETQVVVPHRYQIDSLQGMDAISNILYVNVSRKFVPVGKQGAQYLAPADEQHEEVSTERVNRWGAKFKEVDKLMAYLCYDQKTHKNPDGSMKDYTVCYEDRFLGIIECEVWRFHNEMDCPSHRVRLLKQDGKIIWDRKNKFSSF
jgi:uncharacterized protein (UPF0248 family)